MLVSNNDAEAFVSDGNQVISLVGFETMQCDVTLRALSHRCRHFSAAIVASNKFEAMPTFCGIFVSRTLLLLQNSSLGKVCSTVAYFVNIGVLTH